MTAMIHIEQLRKTFAPKLRAVDGIDLLVNQGEIMALLGPNGAGKTTAIRVLATLAGFDAGKVSVAGFDLDKDPKSIRQNIGYVAQQTGVDFFLTGRENLLVQGRLYHLKPDVIVERCNALANYFGFQDYLDQTVNTYSGGMRRKLDIATALIHQPKVLFLDEPTLGLDVHSRHNLWQLIKRLNHEQNLTILLTTHYLDEADKLAHRVAIINKGKIVACDRPDTLKRQIKGEALVLQFDGDKSKITEFITSLVQISFVKEHVLEEQSLHLYVEDGVKALSSVVTAAKNENINIANIALAKPDLDDVFLKYTGSSMDKQDEEDVGQAWWQQWSGKSGKWNIQNQWQQDETTNWDQSENSASVKSENKESNADWKKWQNKQDD